MFIKNFNTSAFSLLEILLASIIFIISVAGVFITLNAVRQPVAEKERQLEASVLGQQLLESLRSQVNADDIDSSGNLNGVWTLGQGKPVTQQDFPTLDWDTINNGTVKYTMSYSVSCADGSTTCGNTDIGRQVTVNVTYPDAQ